MQIMPSANEGRKININKLETVLLLKSSDQQKHFQISSKSVLRDAYSQYFKIGKEKKIVVTR